MNDPRDTLPGQARQFADPKQYLLTVMNDATAPIGDRLDAAITLLPYFHAPLASLPADE